MKRYCQTANEVEHVVPAWCSCTTPLSHQVQFIADTIKGVIQ